MISKEEKKILTQQAIDLRDEIYMDKRFVEMFINCDESNFAYKKKENLLRKEKTLMLIDYYLDMNGMTKEEIRAERDMEIIDLIRNNIAPDTHEQERLIEEIIEMIEENK